MGGKHSYPSPAMAVAFIALLAALSGTAVALPGSNTVTSGDLKTGAVRSSDIRNNSVRGADVRANTLKGSDVDEGSLGQVPRANRANSASFAGTAFTAGSANTATRATSALNAANAGTAQTIGGTTVRSFRYRADADADPRVVLELAGLRIEPNCDGGDLDVIATSTEEGDLLSASEDPLNSIEIVLSPGGAADLVGGNDDDQVGHTEWASASGRVLTINWQSDNPPLGAACQFAGTAVGSG